MDSLIYATRFLKCKQYAPLSMEAAMYCRGLKDASLLGGLASQITPRYAEK
jgi:hypothetical protein